MQGGMEEGWDIVCSVLGGGGAEAHAVPSIRLGGWGRTERVWGEERAD